MWTSQSIGMVDAALLAVLVVSVLVGLWRGGVYEVMAVLGWVVAYVAAQAFAPVVAPDLPLFAPDSALRIGLALALVFFVHAARLVAAGMAAAQARACHAPHFGRSHAGRRLRPVSRHLPVAGCGHRWWRFTPAQQAPGWQRSRGAQWLGVMLEGSSPCCRLRSARYLPE
jgi:membrane protein required for colicin V production